MKVEAVERQADPELARERLRRSLQGLREVMMRFAAETYGADALDEAWREFAESHEEESYDLDAQFMHSGVFEPWYLHRWAPDPRDTQVSDKALHGRTPASVFGERRRQRLDPTVLRYLDASGKAAFAFYEVLRVATRGAYRLRDVIAGVEIDVPTGTIGETLERGDILFAQVVVTDGIVLLEHRAVHEFPPIDKLDLIELRGKMALEPDYYDSADARDIELRTVYLTLMNRQLMRELSEYVEPFGKHRAVYEVDSAEIAFDRLKHLAFSSPEEIAASAQRAANGELQRVQFHCAEAKDQRDDDEEEAARALVTIEGTQLVAETLSEDSAEWVNWVIERKLGRRARFRTEELIPPEPADVEADAVPDDTDLPEVRANLARTTRGDDDRWATEPLALLGGRTPLEAVEDETGRERVAALLRHAERDVDATSEVAERQALRKLRKRLGLTATE